MNHDNNAQNRLKVNHNKKWPKNVAHSLDSGLHALKPFLDM